MIEYAEKMDLDKLVLTCIHCGFCLQSCPTYRILGYEPDSPRGRLYLIRALLEKRIELGEKIVEHLYKCIVCRGCETACPSSVRFGILMDMTRSQITKKYRFPLLQAIGLKLGAKVLVSHINLLRYLLTFNRLLQKIGIEYLVRLLPKPLSELDYLMPPSPSSRIYYPKIQEVIKPVTNKKLSVGFLQGCLMEAALPWVNRAVIRILLANGCEVITPRGQTCCGAASLHEGFIEYAKKLARKNIDVFENVNVDFILASASGCVATLKMYDELLKDDPEYAGKARKFKRKVRDFSELLLEIGMNKNLGPVNLTTTFHDSCGLAHAQKITQQPRIILRAIPGLSIIEMKDSDLCCGAGGLNWLFHPEITKETLMMKLKNAAATGASTIAVSNIPCYLNISRGIKRLKIKMNVVHYAELLDKSYRSAKLY
ncbi:MAG: (Fe-S)-binding protein [Nitrososphaerota archaeon]